MASHSSAYSPFLSDQPLQLPTAITEQELIDRMMTGDEYAWMEFNRRYGRLIFRCITKVTARFTSVVCAEDTREIYATLLLQLLSNDMHKLRSFDPSRGNRFGTWIGMLAINASYDHLRSIRRETNRGTMTEAERLSCENSDPFDEVCRKQREQILTDLLAGFSEKDRLFVMLYFDQGLEPEEVAQRMRISVKTVYSKKHKIRTRLEQMLQHERLAA